MTVKLNIQYSYLLIIVVQIINPCEENDQCYEPIGYSFVCLNMTQEVVKGA
jgi:hypothetical protein